VESIKNEDSEEKNTENNVNLENLNN